MFGHAQPVVDGRIGAGGIQPRGGAHLGGAHAGHGLDSLGRVVRPGHELAPGREAARVAALGHVGFVDQTFGDDHVGHGRDHGHVGAWPEREVVLGAHVRRVDQIDAPRIDDHQPGALAQPALHARGDAGAAAACGARAGAGPALAERRR